MKTNKLFLMTAVCGVSALLAGCSTTCPTNQHVTHEQYGHEQMKHKHHKKDKSKTAVFYQNYDKSGVDKVKAKIYTRSSRGGESEMGTIKFKETNDGLKMYVDLIDLRPGKIYTAEVYQCWTCNSGICCNTEAMAIDLPTISINNAGRLQQSYIIRGLTASQLNNAKLILTRDGGYKAAWGTLNQ